MCRRLRRVEKSEKPLFDQVLDSSYMVPGIGPLKIDVLGCDATIEHKVGAKEEC